MNVSTNELRSLIKWESGNELRIKNVELRM